MTVLAIVLYPLSICALTQCLREKILLQCQLAAAASFSHISPFNMLYYSIDGWMVFLIFQLLKNQTARCTCHMSQWLLSRVITLQRISVNAITAVRGETISFKINVLIHRILEIIIKSLNDYSTWGRKACYSQEAHTQSYYSWLKFKQCIF